MTALQQRDENKQTKLMPNQSLQKKNYNKLQLKAEIKNKERKGLCVTV